MIELAVALIAGGAVFMLVRPRPSYLDVSATRLMSDHEPSRGRKGQSRFWAMLSEVGRVSPLQHAGLTSALTASGAEEISAHAYRGVSLILAVLGSVVGLAFGALSIFVSPGLGVLGYRLPSFWLQSKARGRTAAISEGLPDALDLLVVCVSAGLNLSLATDRVADRTSGPLGHELRRVQRLTALGVPRREALSEMEIRSGSSEVAALVSALVTTDRFGSSVAGSLEGLASDLRAKRRRSAEEQARRAPVKMLFPLVFLILPAFILLTIVPLLLGTFRTLGL